MRKHSQILAYLSVTGILLLIMIFTIQKGQQFEKYKATTHNNLSLGAQVSKVSLPLLARGAKADFAILLSQIALVLLVSKAVGFLFNKIGQPTVVGQILAGILLGPSLLGRSFPGFFSFIFPKYSFANLLFVSHIGLLFFMFVIGMELDLTTIRAKLRQVIIISHAGIIIPYSLGVFLSYFLYQSYAPGNADFMSFSLFIGIAMSITAFPVLASILRERGFDKTRLGVMALASAATGDLVAWCILAAVISIRKEASLTGILLTYSMSICYILVMLRIIKPLLKRLSQSSLQGRELNAFKIVMYIMILLGSAYTTGMIGIHSIFGAFLAGVVIPKDGELRKRLISKIQFFPVSFLLPVFFAFSGLRTELSLLNSRREWITCGLVIFIAVLGKFGGSLIAAKSVGESWRDSVIIGILMNTKGLVELIVLNIGYELGILSPVLFSIFILMAIATTLMTGPLLTVMKPATANTS